MDCSCSLETILVVDDNVANLKIAEKALNEYYKVILLTSGSHAIRYLGKQTPDLILLDISMPQMDGYETLLEIKKMPGAEDVPVIFLTADTEVDSEVRGLQLGAVDFIVKPFVQCTMLSRIRTHLELFHYRKNLEQIIQAKTRQIERVQDALVVSLADLVECRDGQTGGHVRRTARYMSLLLHALYERNKFPEEIGPDYIRNVERGSVLHDIGKVGIADMALLKSSSLNEQEMEYMRQHTVFGGRALKKAADTVGEESFLNIARDLAYCHHEKWNGQGYPNGLAGNDIPLGARILALADVYDALTSRRSYKEPFSHEKACEIILGDEGTAFDPRIIEVFEEIQGKFQTELEEFRKGETPDE